MNTKFSYQSTECLANIEKCPIQFFFELFSDELLRMCGDLIHFVAEDEHRDLFLDNNCPRQNVIEVPLVR